MNTYDRSILACILRASVMRDTDRENHSKVLAGVLLEPDGCDVRCVATNGKSLAVVRANGNGVMLTMPFAIGALGLQRIADLYRRNKQEIAKLSWKRGETGLPIVTVRPITPPGQLGGGLIFEVPSTGDSATVPLVSGSYPVNYRSAFEKPIAWTYGFPTGTAVDVRMIGLAAKVLPNGLCGGLPMPRTDGSKILFLADDQSYVGIMPIRIDSTEASYPFGRPADQPAVPAA